LAGRRYFEPERVLDSALQYGFLVFEEFRGRIQRPEGATYADMVTFVADQKLSASLKAMIGEMCRKPNCTHAVG